MHYEFTLPKNKTTNKFAILSNAEKLKTIEVGMTMVEQGSDKLYTMNNRDWETKLQNQKEEENMRYNKLLEENDKVIEKNKALKKTHQQALTDLTQRINIETANVFSSEIGQLKKEKTQLKAERDENMNTILSIQNKLYTEQQHQFQEQQKHFEDREKQFREEYEAKLQREKDLNMELSGQCNNSAKKGRRGENWLFNELIRQFQMAIYIPFYHLL